MRRAMPCCWPAPSQWDELKAALPPGQARAVPSSAFAYADARLMALQREALFQLQSVLNGCHRRWPELDRRATPGDAAVANWCEWVVQHL